MKWLQSSSRCNKYPINWPCISQNLPAFRENMIPSNNYARFKSSTTAAWLNRQRNDHFLKARAQANYRSRSAFKLVQINEQYQLFPPPSTRQTTEKRPFLVVDLGCAPGGWTQASLELLGFSRSSYEDGEEENEDDDLPQVVGVDLIQTEPILGARFLRGNFLDEEVQLELQRIMKGNERTWGPENKDGVVDIILSDMAPNLTGNRVTDVEAGLELCRSILAFAQRNLRRTEGKGKRFGGSLVIKHFAAPELTKFREEELAPLFSQKIRYTKPEASRSSSSEAYFVCQGFKGPKL